MEYNLHQIPLFKELEDSQNILLAGAGGGFDIFSGLPLYFSLKRMGKNVVLGNFSFTWLRETSAQMVFPHCFRIESKDQDRSGRNYFPEKHLKLWLGMQGEQVDVYAFEKTGVNPLKDSYKYLKKTHDLDTVLLVDGGTDSLMFGDEEGLGTPQEDICSMAAAYRSGIKKQLLVCIGFGIDHYHGVSHYHFLENVALLAREGGYLGAFQLLQQMPEVQKYQEAIRFANERMRGMESIVSNSILSALEGEYGNQHRISRTRGSELWINPLMSFYWAFELRQVVRQVKYFDLIKDTNSMGELNGRLSYYRARLSSYRPKRQIPI
ncbi:MAG: DUF1152 domain-containing protein [Bacteroidota bacterium]